MKKVFLLMALVAFVFNGFAQVLKSDVLKDYSEGDILEKAIYSESKAPIQKDTWCAAYNSNEKTSSPVIGKPLSYIGYAEGGPSIKLGMQEGSAGYRSSVFSMTDSGKDFSQGTYYLAFLVNVSKIASKEMIELVSMNANYNGSSNRGLVYFGRGVDAKKMKLAVGFGKNLVEAPVEYDYRKTHLLVLKVDFSKNEVSLFINPDLNSAEPTADAIISKGVELKAGLRAFSFRNRSGHSGNIGNFKFVSAWSAIAGE